MLGARGAGASELLGVEADVDLRMGTFSKSLASCGGFIAGPHEVIDFLRISSRRVPVHGVAASRPRSGAALAALRIIRSPEGPELLRARARQRALPQPRACTRSASASSRASRPITPIVPVVVGDDWKAVLLWRALYDAGVYVNVAIHPAVPPGGALLRTSVMATHDRAVLDRALAAFENVKQNFEREHGPLPEPRRIAHSPDGQRRVKNPCSLRMRRVVERCLDRRDRG